MGRNFGITWSRNKDKNALKLTNHAWGDHHLKRDYFKRKTARENNPQQIALEVIMKQYPDYSQILLLGDHAENNLTRNAHRRKVDE